jgi:DNA-binding PadR family transcriptional regulator
MAGSPLLTVVEFILLSFAFKPRTGRELRARYLESSGRKISDGTLYVTISRLKKKGWLTVTECEDPDGRLRRFQITGLGQAAWKDARSEFKELGNLKLI